MEPICNWRRLHITQLPHYRLPALHRLLGEKSALAGAEVRDVATTLALVFGPRTTIQPQRETA